MIRVFSSFILVILSAANVFSQDNLPPLSTLYRWKLIEYEFISEKHYVDLVKARSYIPANVIPLGISRWKDKVFVSTPRWKRGVPATLSTLPVAPVEESPPLKPYPDWEIHNAENCTGLTSVFRMTVDHCNRLWVLDSGQVEAFETPQQLCPPQIVVFDLNTDAIIARYPIPERYVLQNSLITNIIVDSRDARCRDLHVYIADAWRFGLIVFRAEDGAFWRFTHYSFYPEPLLSNYTLHGLNFQWSDGLFGMALGRTASGDRTLYYHSMSSQLEFAVQTSVLRNPTRVADSVGEFRLLGEGRGDRGQVSAAAVDRKGVMFFNLISRDSIGCWDTQKPYQQQYLGVVAQNNESLLFANDLRIDNEIPQTVWIISNKLPFYQFNLLKPDEYNFRVLYLDPDTVKGTVCDSVLPVSKV